MATGTDALIKILNDLIASSRDSEEGLRKAAKGAHDDHSRDLIAGFAKQHSDFAEKVEGEIRRLGHEPEKTPHVGAIFHSGWIDLEGRIRPKGDRSFLEECRRGEEGTLKHFQHALEQELPEDIRKMVELESRVIQGMIERLESMHAGRH